jgi:hypothetical protein
MVIWYCGTCHGSALPCETLAVTELQLYKVGDLSNAIKKRPERSERFYACNTLLLTYSTLLAVQVL